MKRIRQEATIHMLPIGPSTSDKTTTISLNACDNNLFECLHSLFSAIWPYGFVHSVWVYSYILRYVLLYLMSMLRWLGDLGCLPTRMVQTLLFKAQCCHASTFSKRKVQHEKKVWLKVCQGLLHPETIMADPLANSPTQPLGMDGHRGSVASGPDPANT